MPCPVVKYGHLLIRSSRTLVPVGTERMLVEFGKAGWMRATPCCRCCASNSGAGRFSMVSAVNPPQPPFTKGGRREGSPFAKGGGQGVPLCQRERE